MNGLTSLTLDKLPAIWGDLVRGDAQWESWDLDKLAEALRLWVHRNPDSPQRDRDEEHERKRREMKLFHFCLGRNCIYCKAADHKANDCQKVTTIYQRQTHSCHKTPLF